MLRSEQRRRMRMSAERNADKKTSWLGSFIARRSFLARLGAGAGVLGATALGSTKVMAEASTDATWKPARHSQDDWLEKIPGQHRYVFDTTTPDGLDLGFTFARNYFTASHDSYGLEDHDLAVLMIARHKSTSFGYSDAMWGKYGKLFSEHCSFVDQNTKKPVTAE